ncbi:mitochondrial proton/calcium exchanger protein-like [Triticum urartu]|uniref:Mitochondrial proton/calcium exchanger protein n=1 Tax=Triticum urartu TaxID=4572 RepID=A0A8R7UUV7_TRIUA|nr:mitochondrial proton/calcium exchanger protein-like [Triticum urartu]XP_048534330.1 mitochondrial proton/calcium exchanger protein-like [Triticum urartu]
MASRAIIRRRKHLLDNVNTPILSSSSTFQHGAFGFKAQPRIAQQFLEQSLGDSKSDKEKEPYSVNLTKGGLLGLGNGFPQRPAHVISLHGYGIGRSNEFALPFGARGLLQSVRRASTATAGQPKLDIEEEQSEDQKQNKKKKEASPEECDQAVEGLSTAKAKAKAKQVQESLKASRSIVQKFWARLLGIGPALRAIASMSRADWAVKLKHGKDEFISTLQHYWLGTKLLWADVRISSRLLVKLAGGKSLSRRERQQLTRTTADIFRLVPVAVFIVVPFMEFLLPVFLKLFPNMLPSTFQDRMKEEEALKRKLKARMEYAKFLQDTAKEMAKEVQTSRSGETKQTAEDLDEFLNKVRKGERVSNDEILNFAKLFNDELTLDNMSRPRLVNMCKYMGIRPFGTDHYLRFMLRKKLRDIKNDDKVIQAEGVESLSEEELRQACRERGHLGLLSTEEMRQQLRDWLDLSLNHAMPSSLLILSRAFIVSGRMKPEEAVVATLSSLPDEVVDTVGTVLPSEDSVSERRKKLEFLEMQEELIKEEEKKKEKEEKAKQKKEEKAKLKEPEADEQDLALNEMTEPTAREEEELREGKQRDKEQLCNISRALAVLASASSVSKERQEFLSLVNQEIGLYNSMIEKEGTDGEEAKRAYMAAREEADDADEVAAEEKVSSALIEKVDAMLQGLEKEIDDVDAQIGNRWQLLDRDHDGKVTPEEVAAAAAYLKDTIGKEGVQEFISNLSKDKEGKILVEDIVKLASQTDENNEDQEEESRQ